MYFMSKNRYCQSHKKCNITSRGHFSNYRVMDLKCLRDEKKRLYTKMFLLSRYDIDSLDSSIPAIKIDNHFFESTELGNYSYFNSEDYDNNILMIKGFASASLFFLKIICHAESNYLKACYITPCLYCFRHYVELTLKDTLWYYNRCGYNVDLMELNEEHTIAALWDQLYPLIGRKDESTRNVGRLLHELSDIDKRGTTFRYSYFFSKNNRVLNQPLNMLIDNKSLYVRMIQIYRFLQGLNDEIVNGYDELSSYNI